MINYANDPARKNLPSLVKFELYKCNTVIPELAKNPDGTPYTGRASGSAGQADWSGNFEGGVPHGKFSIEWGGRHGGYVYFEHGVIVEEA